MIDWQKVYAGLHAAGFTDGQIAELGGLSRRVVNRVRNNAYQHETHEPGYEGGQALLDALTGAVKEGILDYDPLVTHHEPELAESRE
uniref:Uncharacterized protein n=1 Tax=viral metagenome TaxID=1070528 RepID=A0A6M3M5P5_9ZZZZ